MKIALAHFRVGETDGVSLEMDKWKLALEKMGHECVYIAGSKGNTDALIIEEMHYMGEVNNKFVDNCYRERKDYATDEELRDEVFEYAKIIEDKLVKLIEDNNIDMLIPNNIWSLGWHLPTGIAFANVAKKTGILCIAHNHDFHWERELYSNPACGFVEDIKKEFFPPVAPNIKHCVINAIAKEEIKKRYGVDATIVPNVFDFSADLWEFDDYNSDLRNKIAVGDNDVVFLQATRICERKGIELAIDVVAKVNQRRNELVGKTLYNGKTFTENSKIVFLFAGMNEQDDYYQKLFHKANNLGIDLRYIESMIDHSRHTDENGEKIYSLWDAYCLADFSTYPSLLEGWGNQFLEAVFAGKPQLVYEYPVFEKDLASYGFDIVSLGSTHLIDDQGLAQISDEIIDSCAVEVLEILSDSDRYKKTAKNNFDICKKYFSYEALYELLKGIVSDVAK